jgi:thiol-disulfide isomerase/thioredoxin
MMMLALPLVSYGDDAPPILTKPAVYGVLFYADWCGSCKALDPKITQAREEAKLDEQDVLFVRLDLTDDTTKHQAAMMAAVMGISDLYESNAGKTGFMLLIDAESGEKLVQLTKKLEVSDIASKIQNSVKTAKS